MNHPTIEQDIALLYEARNIPFVSCTHLKDQNCPETRFPNNFKQLCNQRIHDEHLTSFVLFQIYFTVLALTTGKVLQEESQYLQGNRSLPESTSFLEPDTISPSECSIVATLFTIHAPGKAYDSIPVV